MKTYLLTLTDDQYKEIKRRAFDADIAMKDVVLQALRMDTAKIKAHVVEPTSTAQRRPPSKAYSSIDNF